MAPPKLTLSISRPEGQSPSPRSKKQNQTTIRYGETARPHISPYSSPQEYMVLHPIQPQSRSSPQPSTSSYKTPNASPSLQPYASPYKSPYASPSPIHSEPQAQEQFLPTQNNLQNAATSHVKRESFDGTMDPPLPPPSSKGAKHILSALTTPAAKKFKGETYYSNADRLLENESSPLYKDETSVRLILQHPMAQASLATFQGSKQLPNTHSGDFAGAAASFKEDGRGGRHDHDWVEQAQAASHARRVGAFDEYDTEHFKKYWATESRELSEDEVHKESDSGCRDDNDKKFRQRDEFDDDDGESGYFGGKDSGFGPTHCTYNNRYGNNNSPNNVSDSKNGSTGGYGNGSKHGGNSSMYDNDSMYPNTRKHGTNSKYGHASDYRPSYLPTPPITPVDSISGSFHSSINDLTDLKDYLLSKRPYEVVDWVGRGYCDNPNSVYPELN